MLLSTQSELTEAPPPTFIGTRIAKPRIITGTNIFNLPDSEQLPIISFPSILYMST